MVLQSELGLALTEDVSRPLVCENKKNIEHLKTNGGDGKEVDGHRGGDVVLKKRAPGLGGRTRSANQILTDAALGSS